MRTSEDWLDWKSKKFLGLKYESFISNIYCLENDESANFDVQNIAEDFSVYFSNLAENLVSQIPNTSNKYGVISVAQYYCHLGLTKKFGLIPTEKDYILKILRDTDNTKPVDIVRQTGRFLKNGPHVLLKLVADICSLSVSLNKFPLASN